MGFFHKRIQSFGFALKGIKWLWEETHARVHAVATLLVLVLGILLPVTRLEWFVLILCITLVWMAEAFNTALEELTDLVHPERSEQAGRVKDLAAGGVLICSLNAALVGVWIFVPYLIEFFS